MMLWLKAELLRGVLRFRCWSPTSDFFVLSSAARSVRPSLAAMSEWSEEGLR